MKNLILGLTMISATSAFAGAETSPCLFGDTIDGLREHNAFRVRDYADSQRMTSRIPGDDRVLTFKTFEALHKESGARFLVRYTFRDEDDGGNTIGFIERQGRHDQKGDVVASISDSDIWPCQLTKAEMTHPKDVKNIARRFDAAVTEDGFDTEYGIGADSMTVETAANSHVAFATAAMKDVAWRLSHLGELDVERMEMKAARGKSAVNKIMSAVFGKSGVPFSCYRLNAYVVEGEDITRRQCMREFRKILKPVADHNLDVQIVKIEGNAWGDMERVVVYVQSYLNPTKVLALDFDIVHEI